MPMQGRRLLMLMALAAGGAGFLLLLLPVLLASAVPAPAHSLPLASSTAEPIDPARAASAEALLVGKHRLVGRCGGTLWKAATATAVTATDSCLLHNATDGLFYPVDEAAVNLHLRNIAASQHSNSQHSKSQHSESAQRGAGTLRLEKLGNTGDVDEEDQRARHTASDVPSHADEQHLLKALVPDQGLRLDVHHTGTHLSTADHSLMKYHSRFRREEIDDITLTGYPSVAYHVNMAFGAVAQGGLFRCVVDSGSSNLGISADPNDNAAEHFQATSTTQWEPTSFQVKYVVAQWTARRVRDLVSFEADPSIATDVEFGAIVSSDKFFAVNSTFDGILGLAYKSLAEPRDSPVEPFLDTLVRTQNFRDQYALKLCIYQSGPQIPEKYYSAGGKMTIGSLHIPLRKPDLQYTPVFDTSFFSVLTTKVAVGGEDIGIDCNVYNSPFYSIIDSGTSDIIAPRVVHTPIVEKIDSVLQVPAHLKDAFYEGTLRYFIPENVVFGGLPDVTISLVSGRNASNHFDLRIPSYHYLRYSIDEAGVVGYFFTIVPIDGFAGLTIGITLLNGYIVHFDKEKSRVGFASSPCAGYGYDSLQDLKEIPPAYPIGFSAEACAPTVLHQPDIASTWIYVTIGVGGGILVILAITVVRYILHWRHRHVAPQMPSIPGVNSPTREGVSGSNRQSRISINADAASDQEMLSFNPATRQFQGDTPTGPGKGKGKDGKRGKKSKKGKRRRKGEASAQPATPNDSNANQPSQHVQSYVNAHYVEDEPPSYSSHQEHASLENDNALIVNDHSGVVDFDYGMSDA